MIVRPADYILSHPGWKLLALALATSIWLTIKISVLGNLGLPRNAGVNVLTVTLHVPVEVRIAATDLRAYQVTPSTVAVQLGGDANTLGNLKESDVAVFITLKDRVEESPLKRKVQVDPPPGLRLVKVLPTEVTVVAPAVDSPNDHGKDSP